MRDILAERLADCPGHRYCIALSGGVDSSVLLHLLAEPDGLVPAGSVRAVHINHGLSPRSDDWQAHCESLCRQLGVDLVVRRVTVEPGRAQGPESAARAARYAEFEKVLAPGECLITAHHRDDQLETVLLRLLRGAGPAGLAGIPALSRFARGYLCRPLLEISRETLVEEAQRRGIHWIEDESNADIRFDRNYVRHQVLPLLAARWPGVSETAARAARHARDATVLMDDLAALDAAELAPSRRIDLSLLRALSIERQRNVLRYLIRSGDLGSPSEAQLAEGVHQLLNARDDGQPVMKWSGGQIRRYRDALYVLDFDPESLSGQSQAVLTWDGNTPLELGAGRGRLTLNRQSAGGISANVLKSGFEVRFRQGGESIVPPGRVHHQKLKKLFQSAGIVPWMRSNIPLLYSRAELAAIGDLWVADSAQAVPPESGYAIVWEDHGALS